MRRVRIVLLVLGAFLSGSLRADLSDFGVVTIDPALDLNGAGSNVDSIAFWEAPAARDTLMFVTAKGNDVVEVWKFPFENNELPAISFPANVNGVVVDQNTDTLYVSDRIVSVFDLPGLQLRDEFGQGIIGVGENNLDLLYTPGAETRVYVSDDHNVHVFEASTTNLLTSFAPLVSSIETVLADDYYQRIFVPEEQGPEGNPGVFVFHPDGSPFPRVGDNVFGAAVFDADEEGIILYTFPSNGMGDHGSGFIVVSDQRADVTDFEVFDRRSWAHLGTFRINGVNNTDGIASTQKALPGYPLGVFAAIDDDTSTVIVGWQTILEAIATPYELWGLNAGLFLDQDMELEADPDFDGRSNLEEFALEGDPIAGLDLVKERVAVEEFEGSRYLSWTLPVRRGASFQNGAATIDGVVYSFQSSTDLSSFGAEVVEAQSVRAEGLPPLDSGWEYRSIRMADPVTASERSFLRRTVEEEP